MKAIIAKIIKNNGWILNRDPYNSQLDALTIAPHY